MNAECLTYPARLHHERACLLSHLSKIPASHSCPFPLPYFHLSFAHKARSGQLQGVNVIEWAGGESPKCIAARPFAKAKDLVLVQSYDGVSCSNGDTDPSLCVWLFTRIYHSYSPVALWKTYSLPFTVRTPSLRTHFHLFLTRWTLSYMQSMMWPRPSSSTSSSS